MQTFRLSPQTKLKLGLLLLWQYIHANIWIWSAAIVVLFTVGYVLDIRAAYIVIPLIGMFLVLYIVRGIILFLVDLIVGKIKVWNAYEVVINTEQLDVNSLKYIRYGLNSGEWVRLRETICLDEIQSLSRSHGDSIQITTSTGKQIDIPDGIEGRETIYAWLCQKKPDFE